MKVRIKEINVPLQVLLGLINDIINGPLSNFPKIYATVSLKKAIKIIKYKRFLSMNEIKKKLKIKMTTLIKNIFFR